VITMQELVTQERRQTAPAQIVSAGEASANSLMRLIERAVSDPQFDASKLQQLLDVRDRWEANEARKAFVAAMAAFKANPPTIVKNKQVSYPGRNGAAGTSYTHATHDEVTNKITAALAPHGLSHRWNVEQVDGGQIRVTCVLTHSDGHSESVAMSASRDDSGSKNNIQALGSAVTYLQRYTLLAVTGLTTADMREADDDGRGAGIGSHTREAPPIPADVKTAITEASSWDEISNVWRGLTEPTRALILKHHREWWDTQKARAKGEQQ
jgi:hypothetical protein